jgi:hypothetical protein
MIFVPDLMLGITVAGAISALVLAILAVGALVSAVLWGRPTTRRKK